MIIKDTLYYGLAKIFSILLSLLTIKLLATNLSVEKFGEVDLYLISISLVSIITGFGINSAVNRELNLFERKIEDVITSSMGFLLKSILIIILAYFINFIFRFIDDSEILFLVLSSALIFTINEIFVGIMRSLSKSKLYFYTSIFQSLIYLIMVYIYSDDLSISNVLFSYLVSYIFIVSISIYYFRNNLIGKFDKEIYKSLAYYGIPLIFSGLAGFVFNVSDKYMLGYYRSLEEVGIYAIAYKVASLVTIVIGIVQMAWPKYMYKIYKEEQNYEFIYDFAARYYLFSLIILGLFVILFADFFILLFSTSDYLVGANIIPIVVFGMILLGFQNISNQGIHISGKSHIMTSIIVLGGFVNIVLNYLFIPQYGYIAAAWTTFISMFVMQLTTLYFSTKLLKIDYSYMKLLIAYFLFILISILSVDLSVFVKMFIFIVSTLFLYFLLSSKEDMKFLKERVRK
jgi:O-antigen/teichoic acid export membrane protein